MKKFIPVLLFIMAFAGFLASQIIWDSYDLNAKQVEQDKQKHSVYETNFQGLKFTTTNQTSVELRNEKSPIVILNFWASWCIPCLKEFPSLVKFQEKYKGQVKVFGINGDEENPAENIKKIEKKYSLNFESAVDADSAISNRFLINTYPVSIVFHHGHVIYVNKRIHDFMAPDFISLIDEALKAK
jgi:thiol-disulfide isomerase/thioredoxin